MPRVNPLRSLANERNVAERIRYERESKGMSYEGLAGRMKDAGAPIAATAIYKIEKGDPPRRITVDELVGFARVFDLDVDDMLLPMPRVLNKRAKEVVRRIDNDLSLLARTVGDLVDAVVGLVQLEASTGDNDRAVLKRARAMMPTLWISYPMGPEGDPATRDPIADAWQRLGSAFFDYARWYVTNQTGGSHG